MEYRILDSSGCFIVELKMYLPNKWYSRVTEFEWKPVKYAGSHQAALEWLEKYRNKDFALRLGDLVPIVERGYI